MNIGKTLAENYEEVERQIGAWRVQVITYCLTDKHVCIVNNLDPKATICRVTAKTHDESLKRGLEEAHAHLSATVMSDVPLYKATAPTLSLSRLEYQADGQAVNYDVPVFLSLPISERMKMILSGNLIFIGSDKSIVPPDVAMRLLNKAASA